MNVSYYLNFVEEKRISMDEYGSELINYQKKNFPQLKVNEFKPKLSPLSKLIFNFKLKMRYSRYISYPQQVKKILIQDIAHICDHQYAHLFSSINSKIKIITVNDLVPIVLQKQIGHKPHLLNYSLKKLKYFDRIIAISETTKKDILKYTDCNEEKISVVMRGVDPLFNDYKINEKETCAKYNLPIKKIKILVEGNIFYKNNQTAFNVLRELLKTNRDIIFVKIGGKSDLTNFYDIKEKIYDLPFIEKKDLPEIYKICKIFLVPTIYTGGSLPILEAMKCGIPVVCSNAPAILDVVGNSALTNGIYDTFDYVKNITNLLNNEKLYSKKKLEGIERSKLFNIEKFHQQLVQIYNKEIKKINL
jgi:glycosyltransferase involved in cell wall biosynthesis